MSELRLLVRLAMSAVRRQWRGTLALAAGAMLVAAALAAVPAFDGVLRDLALREALQSVELTDMQVRVTSDGIPLDRTSYSNAQAETDAAVGAALAGTGGSQVRMGTTHALALHEIAVEDGRLVSSLVGTVALRFRSGIEDHVTLVQGAYPQAQPRGGNDPIPVLVGAGTAEVLEVGAGELLALHTIGAISDLPTLVEVVGVARPLDPRDPYWSGNPQLLERTDGATFALLVPEATFFGAAADLLGSVDASFEASYAIRASEVRASDAAPLIERVRTLAGDPDALPSADVESDLPRALAKAGEVTGLGRTALTLLLGQVAAAAGVFVAAVSAQLARSRRSRHEALALRGASASQRTAIEAFTVLPAALAALVLGPLLAAASVAALGRLDAIGGFAGSTWLRFDLTPEVALYGAGGAAAAFALALIPAALVARRGAEAPMPDRAGRPGLAAAAVTLLLAAAGAGFWALTRGNHLFTLDGSVAPDHALLLAPAALLLPAAVGGWWLLPHLARPLARAVALSPSIVWIEALRTVARRPAGAAFALVVVAAAAAVLLATLPDGLDRSPGERAAHAAGADVRASDLRGLEGAGESAFRAAIATVPADAASPAARVAATLTSEDGSGQPVTIELLGVEPETFGAVAAVRADFATQPLDAMLGALATNSTALGGISAPPGTRQLGAWVRLHGIAGELRVALSLTDATGRSYELLLGHLRPGALVHWGFLAADLATPIGLDGTPIGGPPIETPLTIHAYYAHLSPEVAANDGGISFGPLMSTLDAPEAPLDTIERLVPRSSEFARRAILHDLSTTAGLEPIADLAAGGTSQSVRAEPPTAPGSTGSTRLDWPATPPGVPAVRVRGLRQETDGAPVLLYASRRTLDDLGAAVGDELRLEVAGRFLNAQAAGVVDHFPTLGLDGGAFAVANLERLLAAVNASPGATLRSGEAWFATSTPAATASALTGGGFDAATLVDRETELAALAGARTLARGWRGVLTLGFGALLVLAAVAVTVEGVAALRGAEREAAVAEAIGGSGGAQLAAVVLAVLVRLVAAAALGVGLGMVVGRWLLDILGADPAGSVIVPPPRIEVAAEPLLVAGVALAVSFVLVVAAAALRYRGWSWGRALQLREA